MTSRKTCFLCFVQYSLLWKIPQQCFCLPPPQSLTYSASTFFGIIWPREHFFFTFYPTKHCQHNFGFSTDYLYNFVLKSTILLYLCRPKPHFALILVKGAEEAWGIGLIGQRLPSRNPVHTRSKMASSTLSSRSNGSQPAKAEIARERTLPFCC